VSDPFTHQCKLLNLIKIGMADVGPCSRPKESININSSTYCITTSKKGGAKLFFSSSTSLHSHSRPVLDGPQSHSLVLLLVCYHSRSMIMVVFYPINFDRILVSQSWFLVTCSLTCRSLNSNFRVDARC
jgi:hypothetical protein